MSRHADTVAHVPSFGASCPCNLCQRSNALLAENRRLREALVSAKGRAVQGDWSDPVEALEGVIRVIDEALAGDAE